MQGPFHAEVIIVVAEPPGDHDDPEGQGHGDV